MQNEECGILQSASSSLRTLNSTLKRGAHHDNHSSIRAKVAALEAAKANTAETKYRQQEGPTSPPNAVESEALGDLFPGR